MEHFAKYYNLPLITLSSKAIFALIERTSRGIKIDTHDLLACCENP